MGKPARGDPFSDECWEERVSQGRVGGVSREALRKHGQGRTLSGER